MADFAERFAAYLAHRWPHASDVSVSGVQRIYGGASRETYRLTARFVEGGQRREQRLILRRDPESSLIETDRATEYEAYAAFYGTSVPVPRPLFFETDPRWLDRPFFVMDQVTDAVSTARLLGEPPYAQHLDAIGEQKWRILVEIAAADPKALVLTEKLEAPKLEACWKRELDH